MAAQARKLTAATKINHADSMDYLIRRDYCVDQSALPRPLLMGIDPGLSGAVAVVCADTHRIIDMIDLPTYKTPSKARKQGYLEFLDVHALSAALDLYAPLTALAILEEPGAMPNQGLSSTFRFGRICGQIHGVLAGHYIPVQAVKPGVWKSALGLDSNKTLSTAAAIKEFPAASGLFKRAKDNDRAEAALLTVFGQKYLSGHIKLSRSGTR